MRRQRTAADITARMEAAGGITARTEAAAVIRTAQRTAVLRMADRSVIRAVAEWAAADVPAAEADLHVRIVTITESTQTLWEPETGSHFVCREIERHDYCRAVAPA
jgi:hypothetical protein